MSNLKTKHETDEISENVGCILGIILLILCFIFLRFNMEKIGLALIGAIYALVCITTNKLKRISNMRDIKETDKIYENILFVLAIIYIILWIILVR